MQRRLVARAVGAALLVGLLCAGCADDPEPEEGGATAEPTATTSDSPSETAAGTPIAGAGAEVDPTDAQAWCGAVTPEQLAALTGFEVSEVQADGDGVQTCGADLPGVELMITWGAEPTKKSFEQYAGSFDRPAGVRERTDITLGDQPAVVATQETPPTAFAGTVVDGRLVQVLVTGVVATDADPADLGEKARQLLAVYVG